MEDLDKSKFNLGYLIKGEGKKDWFKAIGNGWRWTLILLFLALIGFTIWKAYFVHTQNVTVQSGGTANIYNVRKKSLIPFVEAYCDQHSGNSGLGAGIRAGLRFEW